MMTEAAVSNVRFRAGHDDCGVGATRRKVPSLLGRFQSARGGASGMPHLATFDLLKNSFTRVDAILRSKTSYRSILLNFVVFYGIPRVV